MNKILTLTAAVVLSLSTVATAGGVEHYSKKAVYSPKYKKAAKVVKTTKVVTETVEAPVAKVAASTGNNVQALGGLEVKLGGFTDIQGGYVTTNTNGASLLGLNHNDKRTRLRNDSEIHVTATGKTAAGNTYGAVVELEADTSNDVNGTNFNADKSYVFVGTEAGRFEMGNVDGAQSRLSVNGTKIARAAGGYGSDSANWIGFSRNTFAPELFSSTGTNTQANASKVSYYSPKVAGLQVGASYTPELDNNGQIVGASTTYSDITSVGANYDLKLGDFGAKVSGGYEVASDASGFNDDYTGYVGGLGFNFMGLQIAGSYGQHKFDVTGKTNFFDGTVAYAIDKFGISAGYTQQKDKGVAPNGKVQVISAGVDYKLAPGIVPYVEVDFYKFNDGANLPTSKSNATVVLVGTQVSF